MGNSEVGHLTLGAGAVVMQDLTRIDDAARSGRLAENPVLRDALSAAERVHLIGLVSDGGVHSGFTHLEALIRLGGEAAGPRPGAPRLHRRPRHAADLRRRLPRGGRGLDGGRGSRADRLGRRALLGDGSRPSLGPDPARLRPAGPRARRAPGRHGRGRGARRVRPRRDRRIHHARCWSARKRASVRPTPSSRSTSAPIGCARSPARWPIRSFGDVDRGGVAPVERYVTMTRYEDDFPYPVAFAPEHPTTTLPVVLAQERLPTAARRRDREVRARDLLLQRRRRGAVRRRAARAGARRRGTCRPTTTSPR